MNDCGNLIPAICGKDHAPTMAECVEEGVTPYISIEMALNIGECE